MSRTILLVRHAKSVGGRHDRHLYPKEGAPLDDKGFDDAAKLKSEFLDRGINLVTEPVAVSQLVRTRQTAEWAGLKNIKEYASLNEVNSGLSPEELDFVIKNKQIVFEYTRPTPESLQVRAICRVYRDLSYIRPEKIQRTKRRTRIQDSTLSPRDGHPSGQLDHQQRRGSRAPDRSQGSSGRRARSHRY